jgi:RNA polymerase sigma-70 factor (ECF subfamily)
MSQFTRIHVAAEILDALKRGDRAAAAHVYQALAEVVFSLALRLLSDRQLANEVMQDTFVDVIERAHGLKSNDAFVGWVRSIAVNHCLMRLRSPWRRRRSRWIEDESEDVGSATARLDGFGDLERALRRLPAAARFVVWMHDVEGYTHAEIARLTGKTESHSKSQLARAHARLLAWRTENDDGRNDARAPCGGVAGIADGGAAG